MGSGGLTPGASKLRGTGGLMILILTVIATLFKKEDEGRARTPRIAFDEIRSATSLGDYFILTILAPTVPNMVQATE